MITKLTKEQEARFPELMDKWLKNSWGETNHVQCREAVNDIYKNMGYKSPLVLHFSSPIIAIITAYLVDRGHSQLYSQLDSQLRNQLGSHYITVWWGTWACYYEYAHYLGVKFDKTNYELFVKFVASIHSCSPYEKVFIYSNKPTICSWKGTRLHNESGMAVEYADGWGWYALNGVVMRPEYVLTPPEKITPEMVLKEENVDQRRELLRKIGVERMVSHGKIIDKNNGYQLIDLSPIMNLNYAPYLLMKNPSVDDTHHLEGVGVECKTVQEAINWRGGNISIRWEPYQLS